MDALEKFGEVIAKDLRDSGISRYLDIESGCLKSESAIQLHDELSSFNDDQKKIIRKIITTTIDASVHDFLFAIAEEKNGICVNVSSQNVNELSDGLQGEIFTEDGWFEKFSKYKEKGI